MEVVVVSSAVKSVGCESLRIVESLREPRLFGKEGVSGTYPNPDCPNVWNSFPDNSSTTGVSA